MKAKHDESENPRLVELARKINQGHKKLLNAMRTSLESAREIGKTLLEAKEVCRELGGKKFLKWVRSNCNFSVSQAQRYMRVADQWNALIEDTKGKELEKLTLVEALKLLSHSGRSDEAAQKKESRPNKLAISSSVVLDEQATQATDVVFDDHSPAHTFTEQQAEQIAQQIVRLVNKSDTCKGRDGQQLNKNVAALAILRQLRIALTDDLLFDVSEDPKKATESTRASSRGNVSPRSRSDANHLSLNGKATLASA